MIGTNRVMRCLAAAAALFASVAAGSCDKDEEPAAADAISLNMMNESNGKTLLGNSDVYINDAGNFVTPRLLLADLGLHARVPAAPPQLNMVAGEMAVAPGRCYQVLPPDYVRTFPSGAGALLLGTHYYNVRVDSWLSDKEGNRVGAAVRYADCRAEAAVLPAIGTLVREWNTWEEHEICCDFPKGCEIDAPYGSDEVEIRVEGSRVVMTCSVARSGSFVFHLRSGGVYSWVRVELFD